MTNSFAMLGNKEIWCLPKVAFLCSDKFSAGSVLKSYDWAAEMKRDGICVISGFHSKLEKDALDILLGGIQPIVIALARSIYEKTPAALKTHIEVGRLLMVSPFPDGIGRPNRNTAFQRNQFVVDNADEIVFAHIHAGGMLSKLVIPEGKRKKVLDEDA
jgi:predicted Rossmann fold nucleotide-binding protein DprA/Smf involved in DNA uptake